MNTKLTLSINKTIINRAKSYASSRNISLSKLVEKYLGSISERSDHADDLAPITESLGNMIKNRKQVEPRKIIEDYLVAKHIK